MTGIAGRHMPAPDSLRDKGFRHAGGEMYEYGGVAA